MIAAEYLQSAPIPERARMSNRLHNDAEWISKIGFREVLAGFRGRWKAGASEGVRTQTGSWVPTSLDHLYVGRKFIGGEDFVHNPQKPSSSCRVREGVRS